MSKVSLSDDSVLPHIPDIVTPSPDSSCSGCPLAQTSGHVSCSTFKASNPAPLESRMEGEIYVAMQWILHRLGMDIGGPPGIVNHPLNLYEGESSAQFAYYSGWKVISVDDYEIVLEKEDLTDPREILLWNYTIPNSENPLINIQGYRSIGSLQPGMILQFSSNSVLSFKNLPTIVKIVSFDVPNSRVTLQLDKTVNNALTHMPGEGGDINVNIWHWYAYPENWQYHIEPDIFYGIRRSIEVAVADVPSDGIIILNDAPVMHPGGWDSSLVTWEIRGRRIDDSTIEEISTQDNRLFVTPTESSVALKTTKPAYGVSSITLADDLTTIYNEFYIVYWEYNDGSAPNCRPLGYARCKFSKPDPTGSSAAFRTAGSNGWGDNGLCQIGVQTDNSDVQDTDMDTYDDTVFPVDYSPSGIARFPANRLCLQYNSCDGWQAAEGAVGRDDNWITQEHAGNWYREAWGAVDIVVYQLIAGIDEFRIKREHHVSLYSLAGYYGLATPTGGDHETFIFPTNGLMSTPYAYDNGTDTTLQFIYNAFHGLKVHDATSDIDGVFPLNVTDFSIRRSPINRAGTMTDRDIERLGFGVTKDDGAMTGRGISQSTVALSAQNLLVCPNVNTATLDETQESSVATFERMGDASDAEIIVSPLRQSVKSGQNIGSRTVASMTSLGGGLYELQLENEQHSYATYSLGVLTTVNWEGGGVYPIVPYPRQEINNYHESPKTTGTRARGAWPGDSIGYDGHYFVINSVLPHGGDPAGSWGGTTPLDHYSLDGDYTSYGQNQDVVIVYDENGVISTFVGGEVITFHWQEAIAMPGATLEWTEFQTDNWAEVDGAVFWHGEGKFLIPDAWFTGKPANICFRAANFIWLDHRGAVPASLHNKTYDAIMNPQEVLVGPGGGLGTICIGSGHTNAWEMDTDVNGCPTGDWNQISSTTGSGDCGAGNQVSIYSGDGLPDVSTAETSCNISSNSGQVIGWPYLFQCLPDDATILSVKAEVNSSGVTRTKITTQAFIENCDESVVQAYDYDNDTTLEGLNVSIARITGTDPGDYEIIGNIGLDASELNKSSIIDMTSVFTTIFNDVDSNALGYALIVLPDSVAGTGSAADLCPSDPPPLVAYNVDCPPESQMCPTAYAKGVYFTDLIEWDVCSIVNLWVEFEYSDVEKTRQVLLFRWPAGVIPS